ncbi:MAG: TlyA family RNA methyltransferase [Oscillospiraceae bacterium]|nr:TlyA family RNA methyltransferase [Oscillospiraceae bacterium]
MKRLDITLFESGLAESRSKARELIISGCVTADGKTVIKPSAIIRENTDIEITSQLKYVGRGGYKLETAVQKFNIDFTDNICLDAGASTGGFTDAMLQKGAQKIYAADVGENQLHPKLKENPRVICLEKQDIRTLILPESVDFIAADLSFISLKAVIPVFKNLLKPSGHAAVLIKPQFEAGRKHMKNGVLKDKKLIDSIVRDIEKFITEQGYQIIGTVESKLNEPDKNREFICYFKRG